jgi:hypothetical protein
MNTTYLLKREINQTIKSLHDFAKWKLIVTSAIAAAALGLAPGESRQTLYWLFLFTPFACAYIDLNCYQYLIRITVISHYLRKNTTPEDQGLQLYERQVEVLRKNYNIFDLGQYAQIGVSMFISIAPVFAVVQFVREQRRVAVVLSLVAWGVGVFLVWFLWRHYLRKNADADKDVTTVAAPAPAVHTGAAAAH